MRDKMKQIVIIGGGSAGYVAAIRAAQHGAKVILIEREKIGGTCLHAGCIPTKCLYRSANFLEDLRYQQNALGLTLQGLEINFSKIIAYEKKIIGQMSNGVLAILKMNNIEVVYGNASFLNENHVRVVSNNAEIKDIFADIVIIATGSYNVLPNINGLEKNKNCLDSTGLLNLEKLPQKLVILGAGIIGLEMAYSFAAFGVQVTIIEERDGILPMFDSDIANIALRHMKRQGIDFKFGCHIEKVQNAGDQIYITCMGDNNELFTLFADKILIATGRKARTKELCLERVPIATNEDAIIVNEKLQTSVPNIYAIGDCVFGVPKLAHIASTMGEIAIENAMGNNITFDQSVYPNCVFISPEMAIVGLTESEARKRKISYNVGRIPMGANGKAVILNGGEGAIKMITDAENHTILGCQIAGPHASDLITECTWAIKMKATAKEMAEVIHPHPTVSEVVREAAMNTYKCAIHIKN